MKLTTIKPRYNEPATVSFLFSHTKFVDPRYNEFVNFYNFIPIQIRYIEVHVIKFSVSMARRTPISIEQKKAPRAHKALNPGFSNCYEMGRLVVM